MIIKYKKSSTNIMLQKLNIVLVALIALYLFACNSRKQNNIDKGIAQETKIETATEDNIIKPNDYVNEELQTSSENKVETVVENNTIKLNDSTNEEHKISSEEKTETVAEDLVDERPIFNGKPDLEGFIDYLPSEIRYPYEAFEKGITGSVYVEFTIDTDGSVIDAKVVNSVDPFLDAEALRAVKNSPKWTPGKKNGNPVKVTLTIPIVFNIRYTN